MPDDIPGTSPDQAGTESSQSRKSAVDSGKIAISASLALVATSAIAHAASYEAVEISDDEKVSEEMDKAIASAISKRSVRDAVSESIDLFTRSLVMDGKSIADEYFDGKPLGEWQLAQDSFSDFGPLDGGGGMSLPGNRGNSSSGAAGGGQVIGACYSNCHSACHGACHGSRGWR